MTQDLMHYGVKGMKWGVRKNRSGGYDHVGRKKRGGTHSKPDIESMSNQELQTKITRIKLENEYTNLTKEKVAPGKAFVKSFAKRHGQETLDRSVRKLTNKGIDAAVAQLVKKLG